MTTNTLPAYVTDKKNHQAHIKAVTDFIKGTPKGDGDTLSMPLPAYLELVADTLDHVRDFIALKQNVDIKKDSSVLDAFAPSYSNPELSRAREAAKRSDIKSLDLRQTAVAMRLLENPDYRLHKYEYLAMAQFSQKITDAFDVIRPVSEAISGSENSFARALDQKLQHLDHQTKWVARSKDTLLETINKLDVRHANGSVARFGHVQDVLNHYADKLQFHIRNTPEPKKPKAASGSNVVQVGLAAAVGLTVGAAGTYAFNQSSEPAHVREDDTPRNGKDEILSKGYKKPAERGDDNGKTQFIYK